MTDAGADKLLEKRIVLINGAINDQGATEIIAKLLYLNHLDNKAPIHIYIDSPGGSFVGGMAILDTMENIGPPFITYCTGNASGIALAILAHGAKGHRSALPGSRFFFTPIWTSETGDKAEKDLEKCWEDFIQLLVKDTNREPTEIRSDMEKTRRLTTEEAIEFGIIDQVDQPNVLWGGPH